MQCSAQGGLIHRDSWCYRNRIEPDFSILCSRHASGTLLDLAKSTNNMEMWENYIGGTVEAGWKEESCVVERSWARHCHYKVRPVEYSLNLG